MLKVFIVLGFLSSVRLTGYPEIPLSRINKLVFKVYYFGCFLGLW